MTELSPLQFSVEIEGWHPEDHNILEAYENVTLWKKRDQNDDVVSNALGTGVFQQ